MDKLATAVYRAFIAEQRDSPNHGGLKTFEAFRNMDATAVAEDGSANAVTTQGHELLTLAPIQSNPDGGGIGADADTIDLMVFYYGNGNIFVTVNNGDGTPGSKLTSVGRHGDVISIYQEMWDAPAVFVKSRSDDFIQSGLRATPNPAILDPRSTDPTGTESLQVVIENISAASTITISSITLSDDTDWDITDTLGEPLVYPIVLDPAETVTIKVIRTSLATAGIFETTVVVTSDDVVSPYEFPASIVISE